MNKATKLIIIGFALMIFGGILFATAAISRVNLPSILVLLTYGYFLGLILIIVGVVTYPKNK